MYQVTVTMRTWKLNSESPAARTLHYLMRARLTWKWWKPRMEQMEQMEQMEAIRGNWADGTVLIRRGPNTGFHHAGLNKAKL
ncbi:hypothetical protein QR685DRAFT_519811 [Neurospora intermedia]|uniref:Uncharacterized protein n=1 Tax=Neurospora intermedia TaxID=5142 RepID=A0ABR3DG62_NEUIN